MFPGKTVRDLFAPYVPDERHLDEVPPILLKKLAIERHIQTYSAFCRAFDAAAIKIDSKPARTYPAERQFYRWLNGDLLGLPYPQHCMVLEAMFSGCDVRQLFEPIKKDFINVDPATSDTDFLVSNKPQEPPAPVSLGSTGSQQPRSMDVMLMDAADESAKILAWTETTNVGDLTVEQIHAEILRAAHSYLKVPTLSLFERTRQLRDRVVGLLANGRQKPSQSRELYRAAGWTLTMLAWISTDLGAPGAAEEHLRTAWAFANNADQNNLKSWICAAQHTAAFWQQKFTRAAQHAENGLLYSGSGSTELYLSSALALDLARCGDKEGALAALNKARNAAEGSTAIPDALPGPFTCSIGRAGGFWSDTHLSLGSAREALQYADSAVIDFESVPIDRRNLGSERMVRCQQVKAYFLSDEFDGAAEALMPILDTAPEHRVRPLLQRVEEINQMTARDNKNLSSSVMRIRDATREFQNF